MEQTPPPSPKFRNELPQYEVEKKNLHFVIFGIFRRLYWLLKYFGILP